MHCQWVSSHCFARNIPKSIGIIHRIDFFNWFLGISIRNKWLPFVSPVSFCHRHTAFPLFTHLINCSVWLCSMQYDLMRSGRSRVVYQPCGLFLCGSMVNFNCFSWKICSGRSPSPSLVWRFVVRARVVIILYSNISKNVVSEVRRLRLSYLTSDTISGIGTHPLRMMIRRVFSHSILNFIPSLINIRRVKFITNRYQIQIFLQVHHWRQVNHRLWAVRSSDYSASGWRRLHTRSRDPWTGTTSTSIRNDYSSENCLVGSNVFIVFVRKVGEGGPRRGLALFLTCWKVESVRLDKRNVRHREEKKQHIWIDEVIYLFCLYVKQLFLTSTRRKRVSFPVCYSNCESVCHPEGITSASSPDDNLDQIHGSPNALLVE